MSQAQQKVKLLSSGQSLVESRLDQVLARALVFAFERTATQLAGLILEEDDLQTVVEQQTAAQKLQVQSADKYFQPVCKASGLSACHTRLLLHLPPSLYFVNDHPSARPALRVWCILQQQP